MYDIICNYPYRLGTGEYDSLTEPLGKRKYPQGCPKRFGTKTLTRNPKKPLPDIL